MKTFLHVQDIGPLNVALAEAAEIKADRYKYEHLGHHKTALLIFFNNSLRTRLSTQKAARNLGLDVMVLDVNQGAWKLETERGVVMDGDKSEHFNQFGYGQVQRMATKEEIKLLDEVLWVHNKRWNKELLQLDDI